MKANLQQTILRLHSGPFGKPQSECIPSTHNTRHHIMLPALLAYSCLAYQLHAMMHSFDACCGWTPACYHVRLFYVHAHLLLVRRSSTSIQLLLALNEISMNHPIMPSMPTTFYQPSAPILSATKYESHKPSHSLLSFTQQSQQNTQQACSRVANAGLCAASASSFASSC